MTGVCAGMSMVPLADIFNHKAAIVQLSDDYVVEPNCYEQDDSSEDGSSLASGQLSFIQAQCLVVL